MTPLTHALKREDAGSRRVVHVGDDVQVALPERATTGFLWQAEVDESVLRADKDERLVPQEPRGAPGTRVFTFRAVAPGTVALRFVKKRAWESEPKEELRIEIEVSS